MPKLTTLTGLSICALAILNLAPFPASAGPAPGPQINNRCRLGAHEDTSVPAGCETPCDTNPPYPTCNGETCSTAVAGDCISPSIGKTCVNSGTTDIMTHVWECKSKQCAVGEDQGYKCLWQKKMNEGQWVECGTQNVGETSGDDC